MNLKGNVPSRQRICMVAYTHYETDPRVRREAGALAGQGHQVDFLCLKEPGYLHKRVVDGVRVVPLRPFRYRGHNQRLPAALDPHAGMRYARTRLPEALLSAPPPAAAQKPPAPEVPLPQPPVQPAAAARSGAFDSAGVLRQDRPGECAPEALATLLALWNVPQDALAQEVQKRVTAPSFSFTDMAGGFNLAVTTLDITLEQIRRLDYPCIIPVSDPMLRYVVLAGVSGNQATLLDPRHGKRSVSLEMLHEQWPGKAFYVWKDFAGLPPLMKRGDAHPQVMVLKEKLNAKNISMHMPLTDIYDSQMEQAVKALQTDYGLKVDGIIGSNTKIALYRMIYSAQLPHLES